MPILAESIVWVIKHQVPIVLFVLNYRRKIGIKLQFGQGKNQLRRTTKFIEKVLQQGLANLQQNESKRNSDHKYWTKHLNIILKTIFCNSNQKISQTSISRKQNKQKKQTEEILAENNQDVEQNIILKKIKRIVEKKKCQKCIKVLIREHDGQGHLEHHQKDCKEEEKNSLSREERKRLQTHSNSKKNHYIFINIKLENI